jgi:hypothetical protein
MRRGAHGSMTTRHFTALMEEINKIKDRKAQLEAARAVANVGEKFNKTFDRARFYEGCFTEKRDPIVLGKASNGE